MYYCTVGAVKATEVLHTTAFYKTLSFNATCIYNEVWCYNHMISVKVCFSLIISYLMTNEFILK